MTAKRIDGKAAGAAVRERVAQGVRAFEERLGRPPGLATVLVGEDPASAVYVTLDRLEAKRMVCSYTGNPTKQRGGRRRTHYLLDTAGQRALVRAYRTYATMIAGIQPELDALTAQFIPSAAKPAARPRW